MVDPNNLTWLKYVERYETDEGTHKAGDFKNFLPNTPEWIKEQYRNYINQSKNILAK